MTNRILIILNTLALVVFGYWLYVERKPEPLSACIIGTATLVGLIWKEKNDSKKKIKQEIDIKKNVNSPISNNVGHQTNNYFQTDPQLLKRIEEMEKKHNEILKSNNMSKEDENKKVVNVTSYNQTGGITANQVNIGNQPRIVNAEVQNQLDQLLSGKKGQTITVVSVMGDGEAFSFATQIKNYLTQQGHTVSGVDQAVYSQPVMGQAFNPDKLEIVIGTRQ